LHFDLWGEERQNSLRTKFSLSRYRVA